MGCGSSAAKTAQTPNQADAKAAAAAAPTKAGNEATKPAAAPAKPAVAPTKKAAMTDDEASAKIAAGMKGVHVRKELERGNVDKFKDPTHDAKVAKKAGKGGIEAGVDMFLANTAEQAVVILQGGSRPAMVVCGPSGVGKGTIINALMKKRPNDFGFSVSHTTRKPRPGEEDGVHYHFTSIVDIEAAIARGEFIEHAHVHGNYYGTSKDAVNKVSQQGKICILDIDVQGATNVKKSGLPCKFVFVNPPSMAELEARLRGRGTETEEKIQLRLGNARSEMAKTDEKGFFDTVITNNELEKAVADLSAYVDTAIPA